MDKLEIKNDLKINEFDLKSEFLKQSSLFLTYSEQLAEAKRELAIIHEKIKTKRSQLIYDAKTGSIEQFKDKKPTDKTIEAWYRLQEDYQDLKSEMIKKEYETNVLESIVRAFYQKKVALEELAELDRRNYSAEPKSKSISSEIIDDKQDEQRKQLRKRRNK